MRRAGAALIVLVAVLAAASVASAKTVRVFAVGPKFGLEWVDTRGHFHDHLLGLVDKRVRGADVQPEADDVASHLLAGERNLVTFPEDLGLMAIFSGSRGEQARGSASVIESIIAVLGSYAPQTTYYGAKYPALTQRGIPTRLLALAGTDTFARVAVETYAEIAQKHGVWVVGGVNMAQHWKVVCQSKATMPVLPSGDTCAEESPAKVAQLQTTDEPDRTYAYEATTENPSNLALLFNPRGELVSKQAKAYLTPIELPGQLDLLPGEVFTGLSAVRTPVGTLGFVTSKDAWMPDVTSRLDQARVDLLVQPEFFVGDTIQTKGPWAPDNIKGSGYSDVLRHPSIEAMVLPELTGNLFDLSADNQQAIVTKPRGVRPRGFLVGQPLAAGFKKVGAWVAKDPAKTGESIPERRARQGAIGEKLLPAEGNPPCPTPAARGICRGGQVEDVIFADVQVARTPKVRRAKRRKLGRTPFTVNRPLAPARAAQRNVALAARGKLVVAAFEQRVGGGEHLLVARSTDGGRRWSKPTVIAAGVREWWPSISIGPDRTVWLAWSSEQQPRSVPADPRQPTGGSAHVGLGPHFGGSVVNVARSTDGGRRFTSPVSAGEGRPEGGWQLRPAITATGPGTAYLAFVDDRARFTGDDLPQAGLWGAAVTGDGVGGLSRLDSIDPPAELAKTLDHSWAPALTAQGKRVELTWTDFRDYEWNVYSRSSTDGGATWGPERAVNDTPDADEALEDTPRIALVDGGPLLAYTDWAKSADSAKKASPLYDIEVAAPGSTPVKADGTGAAHVNAFSPAIAGVGKSAIIAWQDHRRGPADVFAARVTAKKAGRPVRVDDSGRRGWNQWRPSVAVAGGRVIAAWEDERDGPAQIFFASAPLRRIP